MEDLKYYENIALSNFDILEILDNNCNIILYPNLYKYTSIDQLLYPYSACIILYAAKIKPSMYGHWCALTKKDDEISFFNPYGGIPDCCLNEINLQIRQESHQLVPYLLNLMYDSPYELHYNEFQFQGKGYDIKTCGRHCCVRVMLKKYNIYQYKNLLDKLCNKYDTDYDGIVTMITTKIY